MTTQPTPMAAERELAYLRERYQRPHRLGCSLVAHRDLGFCSGCTREPHSELMAWQLLAMIDRGMVEQ